MPPLHFLLLFQLISCIIAKDLPTKVNENEIIKINELVRTFPFDNPDGGAWKQGWPIVLEPSDWQSNTEKLEVFVVPHSHNDPGWIKTFEDYFNEQTQHIITSVVDSLLEDERQHFIWAEISYFDKWWKSRDEATKSNFRNLLASGRFEFVTGGWVMNDEATSTYASTITHLSEGHEWLRREFNYKPVSGWSIDPFGYSPTQAYILSLSGFDFMLIQRVHYALKKHLSKQKHLEFYWRQQWTASEESEIFTHMMPFFSYDIPHTCGPEPAVCALFEFSKSMTAWGGNIVPISDQNLKSRSEMLVDQYRKKSTLYRTKSVLIPLGDDFTYGSSEYTNVMFSNHQKLHDYINSEQSGLHTTIKFSNLTGYFRSAASQANKNAIALPLLSGDFYTYADRMEDYWSGFFTSRSFWKHLDRLVEATVRAGELLHLVARTFKKDQVASIDAETFSKVQIARQAVSLFQHHDGITGTSKPHVVIDYGNKLHNARWAMKEVIADMANVILHKKDLLQSPFSQTEKKQNPNNVITLKTFHVQGSKPLIFFNPLAIERKHMAHVIVDSSKLRVVDADGNIMLSQINPVWGAGASISSTEYELFFLVDIPPLGFSTYFIEESDGTPEVPDISVTGYTLGQNTFLGKNINSNKQTEIVIENSQLKLTINSGTGFISAAQYGQQSIKLSEDLMSYHGTGGAYLFLPTGEPSSIAGTHPLKGIRVIKGPLVQEVQSIRDVVPRKARLYVTDDILGSAIEVIHDIDLTDQNSELVARYTTDLVNDGEFCTDLNGFQMQRRKHRSDKPIQFNFYPVTQAIYLQDSLTRFTVHTRQAMAASSRIGGSLELMMDRKLTQDDARGLGGGVTDNVPHRVEFLLQFETKKQGEYSLNLSPSATILSDYHNHPVHTLEGTLPSNEWKEQYATFYTPVNIAEFPRDIHIISLRARDPLSVSTEAVLQLTRYAYDSAFGNQVTDLNVNPLKLFSFSGIQKMTEKSLTLMHHKSDWTTGSTITFKPKDLRAFVIEFDGNSQRTPSAQKITPVEPVISNADKPKEEPVQPKQISVVPDIPSIEKPQSNIPTPGDFETPKRKDKEPVELTDDKHLAQIKNLERQVELLESEKDLLKNQLETEIRHASNNRFIAVLFIGVGLLGTFLFRRTKSVVVILLISTAVNVIVPLFLFMPEINHPSQ